jgi:segregation and condensation protein A
MLLPIKKADSDEEVEDPRAELARRLLQYERIKVGAARLDQLPLAGRDFVRAQVVVDHTAVVRLPEVDADDLKAAWADVLKRARLVQHHRVDREELSVREYMTMILRTLQTRRFAEFQDLFEPGKGVPVAVVTFVAMLELARELLVQVTQAEPFAPIYVRLSYLPS